MRVYALIFLLLVAADACAELVWSQDTGWRAEGGLLQYVIDNEEDADSPLGLMNKAKSAQENGSNSSALSAYKEVCEDYPYSVFAPEAYYQRGIIFAGRRQFTKANKEFLTVIRRYPDYDKFNQVVGAIFAVGERIVKGERPKYFGIVPGFRNYDTGVEILEGVIEKAPYSEYAPMALMNIAKIAAKRKSPELAIDALDRLINNYPESGYAQDAYLSLAATYSDMVKGEYYDQGATREAMSYFEDFILLYPDSPNIAQAEAGLGQMKEIVARSELYLGDFYYKYRNNNRAALILYNEAITLHPQSEAADQARRMIEKINQGVSPPSTPVDWLFGRYESSAASSEESMAAAQPEAVFDTVEPVQDETNVGSGYK